MRLFRGHGGHDLWYVHVGPVDTGDLTTGYDLSVIAYVLEAPDFKTTVKTEDPNYIGFITSSLLLGAFIGSIPASYVADIFSRRTASECCVADVRWNEN